VIRGGSCGGGADYLQVGGRDVIDPLSAYNYLGFRFARTN
jgi:formylglycine-generating enzyme required for sulfatase activity